MAQTAAELQRSQGNLRVRLGKLGERTMLGDLYQQGCLKARIPRHASRQPLEIITINTAGGLTDGDEVTSAVHWDSGTRGIVTTQAAERIYHCRQGPATINTTLTVGDDAIACWLPQETILFDRSRLERNTRINLGENAVLFAVESLVFGRIAMREVVRTGQVFDRMEVRRDGRLILADAFALGQDGQSIDESLGRTSAFGTARCCATVVIAGNNNDALLGEIRATIVDSDAVGGASNPGPVITCRLLAHDSKTLRELIVNLYEACLGPFEFSVPRSWHC